MRMSVCVTFSIWKYFVIAPVGHSKVTSEYTLKYFSVNKHLSKEKAYISMIQNVFRDLWLKCLSFIYDQWEDIHDSKCICIISNNQREMFNTSQYIFSFMKIFDCLFYLVLGVGKYVSFPVFRKSFIQLFDAYIKR